MTLSFKNTVDKKVYNFYNLTDINDSKLFYHLNISLPENIPDGSYEYTLYDDGLKVIAVGNVMIGNYKSENTAYTKNNTFIQYKP